MHPAYAPFGCHPSRKETLDRRIPWRDLLMRAKTDPTWPWMPGARGLEVLRNEALKQGRWRQTPEGHIEKGPFPTETTSVNVTPLGANRESGETNLSLTPRNAVDSPRVYERLRAHAAGEQRSLNREAIRLLERALETSGHPALHLRQECEAQLAAWRALVGRWQGADEETNEKQEEHFAPEGA